MKIITLKIEISQVDQWDVNWENEGSTNSQLRELKHDVKSAISEFCGIDWENIGISAELTSQP